MKPSRSIGLMVVVWCILALVLAGCLNALPDPSTASAKNDGTTSVALPGEQKNNPGLPPEAAIAACSGKAAGDPCRFTDKNGVASGQCDEKPGVLSCAPAKSDDAKQIPERMVRPAGTSLQVATTGSANPAVLGTSTAGTGTFVLTSDAGPDGGTIPDEYSCDGSGSSPALSWSGAPEGTREFALMMTTLPVDGSTRWNWVLYHIPGTATGIARNGSSIGTLGTGSHGTVMMYDPPCSQGPGAKLYTFTLYALSASPDLTAGPEQVTGPVLTDAISSITLAQTSLNLNHARAGQT
jgi:phosphatidylethanolamine-binding protein (PEBP) family uncharacterized protein